MKSRSAISAGVCAAILAAAMSSSAVDSRDDERIGNAVNNGLFGNEVSRVLRGFAISPVPLSLQGKNFVLVGLGSYLVNAAGGCNDCHTHPSYVPGGDPFKGESPIINAEQYLSGGRQFGPFTSANITPNADGLPAGLTFEAFKSMMLTGRDPRDPNRIIQVMPWPMSIGA